MAWIESHQDLKEHPKVADLMAAMEWDLDTTLGKLHRFWWWCVDYAEDGDLRKHNDNRIAQAMGVATADARRLIEAMVESRWIDRQPYFRVHDWWSYTGRLLKIKYGKDHAEKWQKIRELYDITVTDTVTAPVTPPVTELTNQPTNQPTGGSRARAGSVAAPVTVPVAGSAPLFLKESQRISFERELKAVGKELEGSGKVTDYAAGSAKQKRIIELKGRQVKLRELLGVVA